MLGDEPPSLMGLALDIGLAGFALGIERIEGLLQTLVSRLSSVNPATNLFGEPSRSFVRFSHHDPRGGGLVRAVQRNADLTNALR